MKTSPTLVLLSLLLLIPTLRADLLVYEGFEYPTGQLRDTNGGTGWAGAWSEAHQRVVGDASLTSSLGETPKVTGGHLETVNGDWPSRRVFQKPVADKPGTYWISFLAKNVINQQMETYGQIDFVAANGDKKAGVTFLKEFNAPSWSLSAGGKKATTQVASNDKTVFVVIRLTVGSEPDSSQAVVFFDPVLGSDPSTPDADVSGINLSPLEKMEIRSGAGSKPFGFDEIRIGTTFASVAPKP